jgi:hypothetical protein
MSIFKLKLPQFTMLLKPVKLLGRKKFFSLIFKNICSDSGSASVEFVLLAIPLFLPILVFTNHFATLSNSELVARTLARESLRAYVTASNNDVAPDRAWQVMTTGARAEGLSEDQISNLDLNFQCSTNPCISPNGRVRAILKMKLNNQGRLVTAEAEEYISPWQWNGEGHGFQPNITIDSNVVVDSAIRKAISLLPEVLRYPAKVIAANR